ncbi:hypothetical protein HYU40_03095 [Candidatus Woesearchaeota archaeon]|nr:hypothetical protein [Candidatus Woesearchaeota archaeon]
MAGKSLQEILGLAQSGMVENNAAAIKEARKAAGKIMVPYDAGKFPKSLILEHYGDGALEYVNDAISPLNVTEQSFIFDMWSHFFIYHGGIAALSRRRAFADLEIEAERHSNDSHLSFRYEQVLYNQPREGLLSVVIGKVPFLSVRTPERSYLVIKGATYIYAESGSGRKPALTVPVKGDVPFSEGVPVLYLAKPFREGDPHIERELQEQLLVLVPKTHVYNRQDMAQDS